MLSEKIIFLSVLVNLIGYFFFFKDIFRGDTRPNLVSWFLWMLGPFIGVFFQIKAGATWSVLPIFFAGFGPLVVVIVSLFRKRSIWKITKFDIICGVLSFLALVIYVFTHDLSTAVVFAILSDLLAYIPTYIKGWKFPETETALLFCGGVISNLIGILVIKDWSFTIYSFGVYLVVANIVMVLILVRKKLI